jgi:glycosyltransferase involved in cell wall biosynthesis
MRILLVTGSLPPHHCGVGDYTERLASALANRPDTELGVLAGVAGEPRSATNYQLLLDAGKWNLSRVPQIRKVIRVWNPDVMHVQYPGRGYGRAIAPWFLPLLAPGRSVVVQTWHEFPSASFLARNFINSRTADAIVVVRPDFREHSPRWFLRWIGGTPMHLIPNGSHLPSVVLSERERESEKEKWGSKGKALIVHFGFLHEEKGAEQLFDVLDPDREHLVLATDLISGDSYHSRVRTRMDEPRWRGSVSVPGFLPPTTLARLLAAADAAVFPFRTGGGSWNSTLHAATSQGTFTLSTTRDPTAVGYNALDNTFFADLGGLQSLRNALDRYSGTRVPPKDSAQEWADIADRHLQVYRDLLKLRP